MPRLLRILGPVVLAAALGWLGLSLWLLVREDPEPAVTLTSPPPPEPPPLAGRPARAPAADVLAAARETLRGGGREERCGPYRLLTDVADPRLLATCQAIGRDLDAVYQARFGVRPVGEPAEAILLFARGEDFRAFQRRDGGVAAGYAGYARPVRGFLALWAGDPPHADFAPTLAHELSHLLHRRALGPDLPPWLSEGLADAIGDPATAAGLQPLTGLIGIEALAARLRSAHGRGEVGSLSRLAALTRNDFDRTTPSYDYEQSALLVRYLLLDPTLAPKLRAYLHRLAAGEPYRAEAVPEALGLSWAQLEEGFVRWLRGRAG